MSRIFISHAANDETLVEEFVDLLQVGVGVHPDDIFCSSLPGMGIPTGMDFIKYIKSKIQNPDFVLLIVTSEFLQSQFCHNEVGASWALSLPIRPLLVPPLKFNDVRGVLEGTQIAILNDKEKLSDLRDEITEKLNLTPYKTSHWERKRDKFLAKLEEFLPQRTADSKAVTAQEPQRTFTSVITTSGPWLKLEDRFYKADRFERPGKTNILLQISTRSAEDDAALDRLRPHQQGRGDTIGFAYQNEGGFARIDKVSSVSHGDKNIWSIEMTFQDDQRGGMWNDMSYSFDNKHYSPDDIAEMRAGRLLINNPPPPRRRSRDLNFDSLESIIAVASDSPVKTDECIVRSIVVQNRDNLETALSWARLEAVFRLKATRIVESIFEFSLGPVVGNNLHVRFRGQRPIRYQRETPETINVEGECDLA
jgi:hypothetical protein